MWSKISRRDFLRNSIGISLAPVSAMRQIENPEAVRRINGRSRFLQSSKSQLWLNGKQFRNVGVNIPNLFTRFLLGDDISAARALSTASTIGVKAVRCFGGSWGWDHFTIFMNDRDRWLAAFDRTLSAASDHGISLIPSLLFNDRALPHYIRKYRKNPNEHIVNFLTPKSLSNRLAVEYVTAIVSRYRDDPRVLFWEIGNEYNLEADLSAQWKLRPANEIATSDQIRSFLIQIVDLIHHLDPNHTVTSGNSDMRSYAWHIRQAMLKHKHDANPFDYPMDWSKDTFNEYAQMMRFFNPSPIQIVSVHQYPPPGGDVFNWIKPENAEEDQALSYTRKVTDSMHRPLFIGEFGATVYQNGAEIESPFVENVLKRMRNGAAPIAAIWAWEFDGGSPDQNPTNLSLKRTPRLAALIRETNQDLGSV